MKKELKGFICGVLSASLCAGMVAFAANYEAVTAGFKVMVNGKEFTSDPPALVVEGRTYLPLRAIGDALGVPVNWNAELGQAEVGNTTVTEKSQYSRTNPAPINTVQEFIQSEEVYGDSACTATVKIDSIIRGNEAWNVIKTDNEYAAEAPEGYEYILAKVSVSAPFIKAERSVTFDSLLFDCYSANNEKYDRSYVGINDELEATMFQGGKGEGYVVFCVKKDDEYPKTVFCSEYDGTGGIWFALYE